MSFITTTPRTAAATIAMLIALIVIRVIFVLRDFKKEHLPYLANCRFAVEPSTSRTPARSFSLFRPSGSVRRLIRARYRKHGNRHGSRSRYRVYGDSSRK